MRFFGHLSAAPLHPFFLTYYLFSKLNDKINACTRSCVGDLIAMSKANSSLISCHFPPESCLVPQLVISTLHILDIRLKIGHSVSAMFLRLIPPNAK